MRLNSSFLLLSRCLFNSKNKPVCQEPPENLNVHLLLIIRLIFNSTKITFFNIVWDTPSITVTSILYFTSISTFSGGLTKSLSISFSSTPAIFAIVISTDFLPLYSLVMPSYAPIRYFSFIKSSYALTLQLPPIDGAVPTACATTFSVMLFISVPIANIVRLSS